MKKIFKALTVDKNRLPRGGQLGPGFYNLNADGHCVEPHVLRSNPVQAERRQFIEDSEPGPQRPVGEDYDEDDAIEISDMVPRLTGFELDEEDEEDAHLESKRGPKRKGIMVNRGKSIITTSNRASIVGSDHRSLYMLSNISNRTGKNEDQSLYFDDSDENSSNDNLNHISSNDEESTDDDGTPTPSARNTSKRNSNAVSFGSFNESSFDLAPYSPTTTENAALQRFSITFGPSIFIGGESERDEEAVPRGNDFYKVFPYNKSTFDLPASLNKHTALKENERPTNSSHDKLINERDVDTGFDYYGMHRPVFASSSPGLRYYKIRPTSSGIVHSNASVPVFKSILRNSTTEGGGFPADVLASQRMTSRPATAESFDSDAVILRPTTAGTFSTNTTALRLPIARFFRPFASTIDLTRPLTAQAATSYTNRINRNLGPTYRNTKYQAYKKPTGEMRPEILYLFGTYPINQQERAWVYDLADHPLHNHVSRDGWFMNEKWLVPGYHVGQTNEKDFTFRRIPIRKGSLVNPMPERDMETIERVVMMFRNPEDGRIERVQLPQGQYEW